jgi:hypothetical protein
MKRSWFILFWIGQILFSCLAEQNNELLVGSCKDNIKNQNEEGVDCGGICGKQCIVIPLVTVPCENDLHDNVITLDDSNYELYDYYCSTASDHLEIVISSDIPGEMVINIYGTSLPAVDTEYELDRWYDLEPGEASIEYNAFYNYSALSGKLYVRVVNGKWNIEICPTTLSGEGFPWTFSGRIIYKN